MMRGFVLQFLVMFSVLCTGLHAPAQAHDTHAEFNEAVVQVSDAYHVHDHEQSSPDDASGKSEPIAHHHHCPMAMAFDSTGGSNTAYTSRDLLRPGDAAALASLTPAPPTEPPLT